MCNVLRERYLKALLIKKKINTNLLDEISNCILVQIFGIAAVHLIWLNIYCIKVSILPELID